MDYNNFNRHAAGGAGGAQHPYLQSGASSNSVSNSLRAELESIQERLRQGLDMEEFQKVANRERILKERLAEELAKNVHSQASTGQPQHAQLTASGTQYLVPPSQGRIRATSTSAGTTTGHLTVQQSRPRSTSAHDVESTRLERLQGAMRALDSEFDSVMKAIKAETDTSKLGSMFDHAHDLTDRIGQMQREADGLGYASLEPRPANQSYVAQARHSNASNQDLPTFQNEPLVSSGSTRLQVPEFEVPPSRRRSGSNRGPAPPINPLRAVSAGVNAHRRSSQSVGKVQKFPLSVVLSHRIEFEKSQLVAETQEKEISERQVQNLRAQLNATVNEMDRRSLNGDLKIAEDRLTSKTRTCNIIEKNIEELEAEIARLPRTASQTQSQTSRALVTSQNVSADRSATRFASSGHQQPQLGLPHRVPPSESSFVSRPVVSAHSPISRQDQTNLLLPSLFSAQQTHHSLPLSRPPTTVPTVLQNIARLEAELSELGDSLTFVRAANSEADDKTKSSERKIKSEGREETIQQCDILLDDLEEARKEYRALTGMDSAEGASLLTSLEPSKQAFVKLQLREDELKGELNRLEPRIKNNQAAIVSRQHQLDSAETSTARLRGKVEDAEETRKRLARQKRVLEYFSGRAVQQRQYMLSRLPELD